MKRAILILSVTLCVFLCSTALTAVQKSQSSAPITRLDFSPESPPPVAPWDFCLTNDGLLIIPDYAAGNIKLYKIEDMRRDQNSDGSLRWLKTVGEKGYGAGQFTKPALCTYNNATRKFGVMDLGLRKIFVYDRIGRIEFRRVMEVGCRRGGNEIKLTDDDHLLVAGAAISPDNSHYAFYKIDLADDQMHYLLPYHLQFGIESADALWVQWDAKGFGQIGVQATFDVVKDTRMALLAWEGDLNVMRINTDSGFVAPKTFGEHTKNYVKPQLSESIKEGINKSFNNRSFHKVRDEKQKMSIVRKVLVAEKAGRVYVVYEGPVKKGSRFWIQSYTLDGKFLEERFLKGQPSRMMFLDKDKEFLYSLSNEDGGDYYLLKYNLSQ